MSVELKGNQIRIREKPPRLFTKFRTKDVGKIGKLQLILGYNKGMGWKIQSYRLNLYDYNSFDEINKDINSIKTKSSNKSKAKTIARMWFAT